MAGIQLKNLQTPGILADFFRYGLDFWYPPNDEQLVVAAAGVASNTANFNMTLTSNVNFPWPCQLMLVLRNRAAAANGPPGLTQVNPVFTSAGLDSFTVTITGKLSGQTITEVLTVLGNNSPLVAPAGQQREYMRTNNFFDEITTVAWAHVGGTYGTTTALSIAVGIACCELGDASADRLGLLAPFKAADVARLKKIMFLDDMALLGYGTTVGTQFQLLNTTRQLLVPGKANDFQTNFGLHTVDVTANTLGKTAHGLVLGNAVRLLSDGDGVPGNVAENTTYYVAGTVAANTYQIAATPGGAAIDLTAAGTFVDGEAVRVLRPTAKWRQARLIYQGGMTIES